MQPDLRNTHLYDSALPWLQNSGGASVSSAQATKGGEHSFAATLAAQHPTDTPSTTGTSQVSASKPHIVISPEPPAATPNGKTYVGEDGLNFWDVVDVINPLQHIPVISHLYRQFTGDNISKGAQILGDTLFGGVIGLAASLVGQVIEQQSGKDPGTHMLTAMGLHSDATATAANSAGALAANAPPSTSPAPPETTDAPLSPEPTVASQPTMESPTPPDSLPNPGIIANMASDAEVTTPDGQPYAAATSAATRTDMAVPVHVSPAFLAKTGSHDPKDPTLFRNRIGADRIHGGSSQRYLHVPERTAMANPASDTPDAFPASGASATQGSAPTPAHLRHQAQRAYQQQHAPSVPADPFADFLKDPEFSARIKTNIEQQLSAMDAERMREQALAAYQQDDAI